MDLNKEERKSLIDLLDNEIRENPYNAEARNLLKKVKETEKEAAKVAKLRKKAQPAQKAIRAFYELGVIPTIDAHRLTDTDIKRMADFFELTIKADEITKEVFEDIKTMELNDYEKDFKPYILMYVKNMMGLYNKMKKIKERIVWEC